ncbi:unnamed protein product, partial [Protopolystoma xenopodis]
MDSAHSYNDVDVLFSVDLSTSSSTMQRVKTTVLDALMSFLPSGAEEEFSMITAAASPPLIVAPASNLPLATAGFQLHPSLAEAELNEPTITVTNEEGGGEHCYGDIRKYEEEEDPLSIGRLKDEQNGDEEAAQLKDTKNNGCNLGEEEKEVKLGKEMTVLGLASDIDAGPSLRSHDVSCPPVKLILARALRSNSCNDLLLAAASAVVEDGVIRGPAKSYESTDTSGNPHSRPDPATVRQMVSHIAEAKWRSASPLSCQVSDASAASLPVPAASTSSVPTGRINYAPFRNSTSDPNSSLAAGRVFASAEATPSSRSVAGGSKSHGSGLGRLGKALCYSVSCLASPSAEQGLPQIPGERGIQLKSVQ